MTRKTSLASKMAKRAEPLLSDAIMTDGTRTSVADCFLGVVPLTEMATLIPMIQL